MSRSVSPLSVPPSSLLFMLMEDLPLDEDIESLDLSVNVKSTAIFLSGSSSAILDDDDDQGRHSFRQSSVGRRSSELRTPKDEGRTKEEGQTKYKGRMKDKGSSEERRLLQQAEATTNMAGYKRNTMLCCRKPLSDIMANLPLRGGGMLELMQII
ncbi:hypothetical protein DFP72DRAFT_861384 [Ephemerocybe angulata]|uniref:Uncharacterized protein n=1 Tax=Ephemerocybe angulata TaxID=980116 RepID=A0A8H6H971_9AGAR|nr:hypothetical protein DFP72DRAFT_861384 [Tulosesus angulatus]